MLHQRTPYSRLVKILWFFFLLFIAATKHHAHAADADFWKAATTYEQKLIFVAGLRSGIVAAETINAGKFKEISDRSKHLPESERKVAVGAAMDVWTGVSNAAIYAHLDEKFIPKFIDYLDRYFANPKNKNAGDALLGFLSEQSKRN